MYRRHGNGFVQTPINNHGYPLCSICIANYNGEQFIGNCIDSILVQENFDYNLEIIVHDDASTDNSVNFIKKNYPQVRLLESKYNAGFCVSNNRMVSVAQGQFILLLNNDAALWADALATLFAHAQAQSPQGILTLPQYDWQTGEVVDRGCFLDPFYNPVPNLDKARTDVAMVIGACLWIPHQLWLELGGFPEWIESIGEDMFLCCLARSKGYPVQAAATSGYRHLQGKSFGGNRVSGRQLVSTFRRRIFSERNKTSILFIFTPGPLLWVLFSVHAVFLSIEGILFSMLRWNFSLLVNIYYNAIYSIFKNRSVLMQMRRSVQFNRCCSIIYYYKVFTVMPRKICLVIHYGFPRVQ